MYRRYTQRGDVGMTRTQSRVNRLKNVLILLLLAAVVALAVTGIPAILGREDQRAVLVQRIQSECDEALRQTTALSRNAGSDSAAILARIRSNVYSIRTVNSLSAASGYGLLLGENQLTTLQNLIDRYLSYLTTGMDTGEYQTNLQTALTALQEVVTALQ